MFFSMLTLFHGVVVFVRVCSCVYVCVSDCGEWKWAAAPEGVRGCPHGPIGSWHRAQIRKGNGRRLWGRPWPTCHDVVACTAGLWPAECTATQVGDGASRSDSSGEWTEREVVPRWAMMGLSLSSSLVTAKTHIVWALAVFCFIELFPRHSEYYPDF